MKRCFSGVMACVGAVVGAGFASGREIVTFFTRFGSHSWWLIGICTAAMTLLCMLCMRRAACCGDECWCALFERRSGSAQVCTLLLLILTSGAMASASGEMIALLWAHGWAYSLGTVGTLWIAWLAGRADKRLLGWIGGVLIAMLLLTITAVLVCVPADKEAVQIPPTGGQSMLLAVIRVLAYAGMNMTMAIGVVCRSAGSTKRDILCMSTGFGAVMALLLGISNMLYQRHPQLMNAPFPIVSLLSCFGRRGFIISALLLYFSILTTLVGALYAIGCSVEKHVVHPLLQKIVIFGLPLAVSTVGFAEIVDRIYAPAGILCLLAVFLPLCKNKPLRDQEMLDNPSSIQ